MAGGTGFLGRAVSGGLLDAGHSVAVMTRNPERVGAIPQLAGATATRGDVTDAASLEGKLEGADAVVCAVQFPNHPIEVERRGLTYDRFDRQGTVNLIRAAQTAGVERFLYLSGAGADPASDRVWYRAKGRAEEALRRSGLSYVIVRPSWAYGPGDQALSKLAAIARLSPVLPQLGLRPQRIQPVHVDDVALAVGRSFERTEAAWDKTYEIGGPDVMTMNEVLHTLLEVMGLRRLVVPVPKALAKLATAPLTLLPNPPMTPQGIEFAVQDGVVDLELLRKVLDVKPVGLRQGLERYMSPGAGRP
ncbi:MAG: NAD(P)H-binding protein [Actinomycetota bacterium]|nr:NAD(P)H-binding protein [Actinomycetota bacterium]